MCVRQPWPLITFPIEADSVSSPRAKTKRFHDVDDSTSRMSNAPMLRHSRIHINAHGTTATAQQRIQEAANLREIRCSAAEKQGERHRYGKPRTAARPHAQHRFQCQASHEQTLSQDPLQIDALLFRHGCEFHAFHSMDFSSA